MRRITIDENGHARFTPNEIVRWIVNQSTIMNSIPFGSFDQAEVEEFYQLLGCSICCYGEIDAISDRSIDTADEVAAEVLGRWKLATREAHNYADGEELGWKL